MKPWLYFLEKFSDQALLLELLVIFILLTRYLSFWILKKRPLGAAQGNVPAGDVHHYLNGLIQQALTLRMQLFGVRANDSAANAAEFDRLAEERAKWEQESLLQAQQIVGLKSEKTALEKALEEQKKIQPLASAPPQDQGPPFSAVEREKLESFALKIQQLEKTLEEYSIIEDELSSLKRYQQENNLYKKALKAQGIDPASLTAKSTPAPVAAPAGASAAASNATPPDATPAVTTAEDGTSQKEKDLVAEFENMLKG